MLPLSGNSSPAEHHPKKFKASSEFFDKKNSFNSLLQQFHHQQSRLWLLLVILFLQILLLFTIRYLPLPLPPALSSSTNKQLHRFPSVAVSPADIDGGNCKNGRIFVYDLPTVFNQDILDNCDNLNPWSSSCSAMANGGFGQRADSLAGIIPENLLQSWYWTDQFVTEIIFHNRILKHKCRVLEPESATAFYIPFYAGLAVGKFLWTNSTAEERDQHCRSILKWLSDQEYYKKSNGWDHFITMGRITWDFRRSKDKDWGSGCIYLPGMRNITRLLIERNPWDYFDVGVPYPTGFHPKSQNDISAWQQFIRTRRRTHLFCFAGATRAAFRKDFRAMLLHQCKNSTGEKCRVVDCAGSRCSNGTSAILETFLTSDFCLQPRGDSFTRRSIFDCMVAGAIPVFFWRRTAYYQYEWFLPGEPGSYSVFIDRNAVKNGTTSIEAVLERFSREEVKEMRERVIESIPKFIYGTGEVRDAFDVAIEGVLRRFKEQEEWEYKWK
ncbi:xyloglucan galactosyltransferase XLT2 [Cucumis melo var. makuwa]|uniref:Xyloglucan galactosyltransferase XLT2 n=1 Tax=Cucumis melo var. makuwa TaxID=1194695 RepID=A0A5D3DAU5_CUCMM|nr:xyloglucan galactosyltransferase XLT2 [Cucumis melo var. makuwa]TYK20721.1 xyloglucan galactosyltransferase XLT2 [Cucumis melo var. makuwa]